MNAALSFGPRNELLSTIAAAPEQGAGAGRVQEGIRHILHAHMLVLADEMQRAIRTFPLVESMAEFPFGRDQLF